jgi:FkbM family methyltransferase
VTKLFYDQGWSGINVEPGPAFAKLEVGRPRDLNLQVAIGATEEIREFWVSVPHSGLSTFYAPDNNVSIPPGFSFEKREVTCAPASKILTEYASKRPIDFMTIDVEGAEGEVIRSMNFESCRPKVLIVESVTPLNFAPSYKDWEPVLLRAEYDFAVFDGLNRFYVDREHQDMIPAIAYPVSVLDHFVTASTRDLMAALAAEQAAHANAQSDLGETRAVLSSERAAHAKTRAALEGERARHADTQAGLADMQASTSWRVTAPMRDLSRLARLIRSGSAG